MRKLVRVTVISTALAASATLIGGGQAVADTRQDRAIAYQDGVAAYGRHDYAAALKLLLPLARGGDAQAQSFVGIIYEDGGPGVAQDFKEALKWC